VLAAASRSSLASFSSSGLYSSEYFTVRNLPSGRLRITVKNHCACFLVLGRERVHPAFQRFLGGAGRIEVGAVRLAAGILMPAYSGGMKDALPSMMDHGPLFSQK
jgi:hypothetical protein